MRLSHAYNLISESQYNSIHRVLEKRDLRIVKKGSEGEN
jgi:hypothetical protein